MSGDFFDPSAMSPSAFWRLGVVVFENIKPGCRRLRGLDPSGLAEVVQIAQFGTDALSEYMALLLTRHCCMAVQLRTQGITRLREHPGGCYRPEKQVRVESEGTAERILGCGT
jgi:hypothetical protein